MPVIGIRIRILVMFSTKNIANAVMIALPLVFGFMSAVDMIRIRSR